MKINLGTIYDSLSALNRLAEASLPRQLAYNVSKTRKAAIEEAQELEKQRCALIEKYGPGNVTPENLQAFFAEWAEARAVVTELWVTPILFDQLPEAISASDLDALAWLIVFPEEQALPEKAQATSS